MYLLVLVLIYLILENGKVAIQSVKHSLDYTVKYNWRDLSEKKLLNEFEDILTSSVKKRFEKKRVGIFLSGGVDSAIMAAICKKLFPNKTFAYTVGFKDKNLDEAILFITTRTLS